MVEWCRQPSCCPGSAVCGAVVGGLESQSKLLAIEFETVICDLRFVIVVRVYM